jgi:hypothetical protein
MRTIACLFTLVFFAALAAAQPVAQLPRHFVDNTTGEIIPRENPEFKARYRFRCLKIVDNQSCTALAPRLVGDKEAYPIVRKLVDQTVKESGVGNYTITIRPENSPGFAGGWLFVVKTERGERELNAIWPALWLLIPAETDADVRRRIAEALGGPGGIL